MAKNYERMAKVWEKTMKANPYEANAVEIGDYQFREWFGRTAYARAYLEYLFDGLDVKKCEPNVVANLFNAVCEYDAKQCILEWMEYDSITEEELKKAYNLNWWSENKSCNYMQEE